MNREQRMFRKTLLAFLICLSISAFAQTGIAPQILQSMSNQKELPKGDYTLAKVYLPSDFGHNTGRAVSDTQAYSGTAWEASEAHKDPIGYMTYGPYAELPAGDYVALLHIKLMAPADDKVATVDSCVDYGSTVLGQEDIWPEDLKVGEYVWVPFAFHDPGGKLEIRLNWEGIAPLRLDEVEVYSVTNGVESAFIHRVPQPVYSGKPNNLSIIPNRRPFKDIFPRSNPPAKHLLVVDLRDQPADWQLATLCLQGLVNRTQPRIYSLYNPTDMQWLEWMVKRGYIKSYSNVTIATLFRDFHSVIKGMIIDDPRIPATKNVATMMAGVYDGIAVSPRLSKELKYHVIADLRGKWKKDVDAYRWSFDHLWPKLNHYVTACTYPDHMSLRDYLVENKVFCFWLSGQIDGAEPYADPNAEVKLMEGIFAKMPINTPVMSYPWAGKDIGIGEGPGVTLFAQFSHYLVGSINASNLSVHSGIRGIKFKQRPAPRLKLNPNKIYCSFIISDGDNLPVLMNGNFPQIWKSSVRGTIPFGWTMSPSAWMLIPDIADYYYKTATPDDYFVSAVSGIGYTYPNSYAERYKPALRKQIFYGFLHQTGEYMSKLDMNISWIMNITKRSLFADYANRIPFLNAIFPDYGKVVSSYAEADYPVGIRNVPVFHAVNGWQDPATTAEQEAFIVRQVRQMSPQKGPGFMHVFVWNWGATLPMLKDIVRQLGPRYQFVRPDQLAQLYKEYLHTKQVLVDFPGSAQYIQNHPLQVEYSVQNVTDRPLRLHLRAIQGLTNLKTTLPAVLKPGEYIHAMISGNPVAGSIRLRLTGVNPEANWDMLAKEVPYDAILSKIPSNKLELVREYKIFSLPHFSGEAVITKDGSMDWRVTAGKDKSGMLCYGPYSPLPKGDYLALFKVKRIGEGSGPLLQADTCVGGGIQIETVKNISAEELPEGEYRYIALVFHHPGGQIETRLNWTGAATVEADDVTIWKILK